MTYKVCVNCLIGKASRQRYASSKVFESPKLHMDFHCIGDQYP